MRRESTGAARFRQKGTNIARPVSLQRALGDRLAMRAERAAVRGEVLFVAQGQADLDDERGAEREGFEHARIIARADQQPDRSRLPALYLFDAGECGGRLRHVFDANPARNPE
jgi:hypothetical protein